MAYEIVVPRLGLTMEEGRIVEWFKEPGESVAEGEPLFAVETDKVVLEVEAAVGGIVHPLQNLPTDPMPIGTLIGYILAPGEALPAADVEPLATKKQEPKAVPSTSAVGQTAPDGERKLSSPAARRRAKELGVDWRVIQRPAGRPVLLAHVEAAAQDQATAEEAGPRIKASPVAKRLAAQAGIDLRELAEQQPGRKILRADVEAAIDAAEPPTAVTTVQPAAAPPSPIEGELIPLTQIRRVIAQRMSESAQTTAPVTLTSEADATELVAIRQRIKAGLSERDMIVPTYTDLMLKLAGIALVEHPLLNATWQEDGIFVSSRVHIAVAVDTEAGLLVPVIRDVPEKSLQQIAEESQAVVDRARTGQAGLDELQGGTFTITNLGTYGIDAFSPIINLPQCAILGVGRIIEKPAVFEGEIVPRKMMALSLTFDHRVVDGGPAAHFLNTVRQYVEKPYQWLTR
jgi:pyruvate dehydrogenase E2 component (dihydrolipoamide acetyltransferase)